jgi:hypothetical protein
MKFARWVFWVAGAFGLAAIVPLYRMPGSVTYYGIVGTLIAWQIAFFVIGANPKRYQALMIPAVLEKAIWMVTLAILHARGQVTVSALAGNAATHGLLGVLFLVAFVITPKMEQAT